MSSRGRSFILLGVLVLMAGCTTKSAVFEGRSPEQVWTAMVAIAEEPRYDKWVVTENNVWVDSIYDRVEIDRTLKRDHHSSGSSAVRESQKLEMQLVLERTDPPAVTVTIRNAIIRGKGIMAIDHFFLELRELLGLPSADARATATMGD
jgi:hypothetical protein